MLYSIIIKFEPNKFKKKWPLFPLYHSCLFVVFWGGICFCYETQKHTNNNNHITNITNQTPRNTETHKQQQQQTIQYEAIQYSTVRYGTVRHSHQPEQNAHDKHKDIITIQKTRQHYNTNDNNTMRKDNANTMRTMPRCNTRRHYKANKHRQCSAHNATHTMRTMP